MKDVGSPEKKNGNFTLNAFKHCSWRS